MTDIHSSSIIHPKAVIGENVKIGPNCIVCADSVIGSGTVLHGNVVVEQWTEIGSDNEIFYGAVLGCAPQDKSYKDEKTFVKIGNNNIIREYVTIHRAVGEGCATTVGDNNYIMAFVHFGHNCQIGSNITLANSVGVSGYCVIEDYANLGGMTGIHQKVRIGKYAMVGGVSAVTMDCPPFVISQGMPARPFDINAIGLRRAGFNSETRQTIHKAVKILFHSHLNLSNAIAKVEQEVSLIPEVVYLLDFLRGKSEGRFGRSLDKRQ